MRIRKVFTEKFIHDRIEQMMEESADKRATEEGMPELEDDMRPEYDFSKEKSIRGKYFNIICNLLKKG